jgi:hypothetical protein
MTRRRGSFEGWAVKLKPQNLLAKDVFVGEMPDRVSVDEIRDAVHIRWLNDTHLVVDTPRWIGAVRVEQSYGEIAISYETNDVAYPAERASSP